MRAESSSSLSVAAAGLSARKHELTWRRMERPLLRLYCWPQSSGQLHIPSDVVAELDVRGDSSDGSEDDDDDEVTEAVVAEDSVGEADDTELLVADIGLSDGGI